MCAFTLRGNPLSVVGACVLCIGLSACSFAGLEPFAEEGFRRDTTRAVGLSPKPVTNTPGFVEQSRGKELEYLPVGVTPPSRVPLKNAKQVEAELNALRSANEARAAVPRPASPYDGKVEPGYKPPPQAPIPPGPNVSVPKAAPAAAKNGNAAIRTRAAAARKQAEDAEKENAPKR